MNAVEAPLRDKIGNKDCLWEDVSETDATNAYLYILENKDDVKQYINSLMECEGEEWFKCDMNKMVLQVVHYCHKRVSVSMHEDKKPAAYHAACFQPVATSV